MEKYYLDTKSIGLMASRAYFIPFAPNDKKSYKREDSSKFFSLNGTWSFTAYDSISDAEEFYLKEGETTIPVPSCVQYQGYDYMQYTNTRYPFPYNPPLVPTKNPAFHYSRRFDWESKENAYLIFEGVDSCFYLYINGQFVGYSTISHRISEFDITPFLKEKDNKIDVLVLKWNAGSYLEDQDKWRLTGIFRDVYLLSRPLRHIQDFLISTKMNGSVKVNNHGEEPFSARLLGETKTVGPKEEVEFIVKNPILWSAETPYLYEMEIFTAEEVIYQKVGICQSEVKDGIYLFNGKPIKLYGVNRHDFHPEKGYAVSYEDMKRDILLMKSLNVNALRTSHYPSSPLLYELCNELGLYVMSESDLETHGTIWYDNKTNDYDHGMLLLGDNEIFLHSILERQNCNYQEHKNFSCINIYSLGNESGWGTNFDKALEFLQSLTDKPIHYEGLWHLGKSGRWDEYYNVPIHMVSRMYPWLDEMKRYLNDPREKRPLVLCEYMHSMGNPGGMKEYWEIMESNPRFMGGYIWEWADHGMRFQTEHQNYGGDYGEFEHDGNFCIDGIVSTDREIRSATLALKRAYQPLGFAYEGGVLKVTNKNFFKVEEGVLYVNDKEISIRIEPRKTIELPCVGNVVIRYVKDDEEVAMSQFIVEEPKQSHIATVKPSFSEKGHRIYAKTAQNEVIFDKDTGEIESMTVHGETIKDIKLSLFRAPTDNDRNIVLAWKEHYLDHARSEAIAYQVKEDSIEFDIMMVVPAYAPLLKAKLTYRFSETGIAVSIDYKTTDIHYYDFLPRLGFIVKLDSSYKDLEYVAYGPYETYIDTHFHMVKAKYQSTVDEQYHHYVKPQESGSHYLPDYVKLSNGKHIIEASGMNSFSALPYSIEELEQAHHDEDLQGDGHTYLSLDYFMTGMGSNACGPIPLEQHRMPKHGSGTIVLEIK